ncbi:hypothetical protein [Gordonia sp. ABSL49_1]|uniref:hypothetical protein n=1 Tax=Gordonia sp. ABSL49_1 TaxID=2920941 RepID=UPI001F1153FB|nr:hypothetical protein [Gordonia sp. ABSL49_1]MCH5643476.1 hypothetical protein [Gordonia sp. ABSL49_1]
MSTSRRWTDTGRRGSVEVADDAFIVERDTRGDWRWWTWTGANANRTQTLAVWAGDLVTARQQIGAESIRPQRI